MWLSVLCGWGQPAGPNHTIEEFRRYEIRSKRGKPGYLQILYTLFKGVRFAENGPAPKVETQQTWGQ